MRRPTGASCDPVDTDEDNHADDCNASGTNVTIAGTDYSGVEVDCYCPSEDCQLDTTGDNVSDCLTPTGDICAFPPTMATALLITVRLALRLRSPLPMEAAQLYCSYGRN